MSSHASCTHEKTKAARAACRAGKLGEASQPSDAPAGGAAKKLRAKADHAAIKFGTAKAEGEPSRNAKLYMSGHCATGNHDRCKGMYALTPCTCTECNHSLD